VGGAGPDWVRGGLNTFDYVDDSPVDHVDRSGLLSDFDLTYGVQGASREQVREAFVDAAPGVALVGAVGGVAAIAVVAAPPPVKAAVVGAITRAFWGAQTAAFEVALAEAGAGAAVGSRCAGAAKAGPRGLVGADFEKWLHTEMKAGGTFKVGGREFDGAIGSRWIEAKSGRYWTDHAQPGAGFEKFKSDIGSKLRIAAENNATLEVHSNTPIPQHVQDWLTKKGVSFFEY
jgi:hypothetical protein